MRKELYWELRRNPPTFNIPKDATQVIFTMISVMCDNKSYVHLKKNDGEFKIWATLTSGMGNSMSNYQLEYPTHDITWEADDKNWDTVIKMLNSGTARISEVKSR